jgi:hypothetical protein
VVEGRLAEERLVLSVGTVTGGQRRNRQAGQRRRYRDPDASL